MSRPISKQEEEELGCVEAFLRLRGHWPSKIENQAPPEPDIALTMCGRHIGIEVTKVFTDKDLRRDESLEDQIINQARDDFTNRGGPPLILSVDWYDKPPVKPSDQRKLAAKISEFVWRHLPLDGGHCVLGDYGNQRITPPSPLGTLSMQRWDRSPHWSNCREGMSPEISSSVLSERIMAKNSKPARYQTPYSEIWLLLVLEGYGPSSFAEVGDEPLLHHYETSFDRVFLANFGSQKVHQLERIS